MPCPFCNPPEERVFLTGDGIFGLWDAFPVSPGHALLVPRRHIPSWFDATTAEQVALAKAIADAKAVIEQAHRPDGYNIGINCGAAAGQTVFHLHVHLIPRYQGDVAEPRGGVRHVIADKAYYTDPSLPSANSRSG
jgi:diadenosine tetraphosphate (Ap4A) HIT family hydrolase